MTICHILQDDWLAEGEDEDEDEDAPRPNHKNPLVNVALANKHFHRVAAEVLWRAMPSIQPLIKLLPNNCWTVRDADDGISTVVCDPLPQSPFAAIDTPSSRC